MYLIQTAGAPLARYVGKEYLAAVAVRELLYITRVGLLLDALASVHSARLAATQSAEHWLNERTERLRRHLSACRREASTQEVIEISADTRTRGRMHTAPQFLRGASGGALESNTITYRRQTNSFATTPRGKIGQ
jgi:hypothetical protein